ncbi:NHLP leader peptide family RiPP precursor [Streptomyces sp. NBC_00286]|uniref:NHLP leader peptide family RiPP precursor n=1 Tax=Streptomyces sp. NBC_00286 TaxID=2975701 RepID=UPI002E2B9A4F|nr:NHLP leader peptide family RiPP precursor [Streptomyces sp. NBC_00286]
MTVMETDLLVGDYAKTVTAMTLARCWRDQAYRERFVRDPKAVLSEEGLHVPAETAVEVVEDTRDVLYVVLPHGVDAVETATSCLRQLLPEQGQRELRLLQNTEHKRYLVIPETPENIGTMTEPELTTKVITHRPEGAAVQTTVEATTVVTTVEVTGEAVVNIGAAVEVVAVVVIV